LIQIKNFDNFVVNYSEKVTIYENFTKNGTFSKKAIELKVMTGMFRNFFTKYEQNVVMKNVQEHDFCSKNDQIIAMSNMPK
jgi:hypothetical protein